MTSFFAIICILLIIFILICLECILRKRVSYIVTKFNEEDGVIEARIREIIFLNPDSEIILLCTPRNPEEMTILSKLQEEFSQLHIIK